MSKLIWKTYTSVPEIQAECVHCGVYYCLILSEKVDKVIL